MTLEQFATELNRHPFQPFALVLTSDRVILIDAPEFACIDRRGLAITVHAADGHTHVIDTRHVIGIVAGQG